MIAQPPPPPADHVVIGYYHDGSGICEQVYGPYTEKRATRIANDLEAGSWQHMRWEIRPLTLTPWEKS